MSTKKTISNEKLIKIWLSVLTAIVTIGFVVLFIHMRNLSIFELNMHKITSQNRALIRDLRNCINNKNEICQLDENSAQYKLEDYPFQFR